MHLTNTQTLHRFDLFHLYRFIQVCISAPTAIGWLRTICVINCFMCKGKVNNLFFNAQSFEIHIISIICETDLN